MGDIVEIARDLGQFPLDAGFRGVPADARTLRAADVDAQGWYPADGKMSLPLISVGLAQYNRNRRAMFDLCDLYGCWIAPHIKTPMSPVFALDMVANGAWGVSVADLRQAGIMLASGIRRILIANQIGGEGAARRLANLLDRQREAEVAVFVDSGDFVEALARTWSANPSLPPLELLVEIGCGRGGVDTDADALALVNAILDQPDTRIRLRGVACYEGTANDPDPQKMKAKLDDLFLRTGQALQHVRRAVGPETELILSAGGSGFFDHVIAACIPLVKRDGNAVLLLRSGAAYFSDHGAIHARLKDIAARDLLSAEARKIVGAAFQPALRLWAEVLTVNGKGEAICGFGLRDVAHDQGLPVPLTIWRNGQEIAGIEGQAETIKLNDQHAFVRGAFEIGDVIEFGIKHPCTTLDKHQLIFGIDPDHRVAAAIRTFFG